MPWDGSGSFTRQYKWQDDATADVKIRADRHDGNDDDIALGISNAIAKDGQSRPVDDIPFNNKKITQLGDPVAAQDAATKAYVDAIQSFATGLSITGADANGRISFTSATGINGLTWTGADLSWLAKLAAAGLLNRLVLNTKADGSGTDVIELRDDGSALFTGKATVKGTSAQFQIVPTAGNGHVYWMAADGVTTRAILYTSGGAAGPMIMHVAAYGNYTFGASLTLPGGAYLNSDGNIVGSIWWNFGANDAYTAINNRIENRAQAWAINYANGCLQQMRSAGYVEFNHTSGNAGISATWSGYYMTMSRRIAGDNYLFGFRSIQHWSPNTGWVQSTAW